MQCGIIDSKKGAGQKCKPQTHCNTKTTPVKSFITMSGTNLPGGCARSLDEIKEEFHKAVDDYIAACEKNGKQPERAFTGNYSVRTSPAVHEALALYAAQQEVKFSQVTQQAMSEFIENHDIEIPNREEN